MEEKIVQWVKYDDKIQSGAGEEAIPIEKTTENVQPKKKKSLMILLRKQMLLPSDQKLLTLIISSFW